jgi:hypothetical protein
MLGAHLLVCQMSSKQVWSQPLVVVAALLFSQCNGHREVFHGLRVQDVKVLIFFAALFLPNMAPASQRGFGVLALMLPASVL